MCSADSGPTKERKNWREVCEYLHSSADRTRILRKVGCVLEVNLVALEQVKREKNAGQRQQQGVAVGCCRCGSAHPLGINAVGTTRLEGRSRELTESALGTIA